MDDNNNKIEFTVEENKAWEAIYTSYKLISEDNQISSEFKVAVINTITLYEKINLLIQKNNRNGD